MRRLNNILFEELAFVFIKALIGSTLCCLYMNVSSSHSVGT